MRRIYIQKMAAAILLTSILLILLSSCSAHRFSNFNKQKFLKGNLKSVYEDGNSQTSTESDEITFVADVQETDQPIETEIDLPETQVDEVVSPLSISKEAPKVRVDRRSSTKDKKISLEGLSRSHLSRMALRRDEWGEGPLENFELILTLLISGVYFLVAIGFAMMIGIAAYWVALGALGINVIALIIRIIRPWESIMSGGQYNRTMAFYNFIVLLLLIITLVISLIFFVLL